MNVFDALKGIGGQPELNRVVGALGGISYIVGANSFVAYETFIKGREFDLTEYCIAFPAGLGVVVGAIAGAVALKDRQVAKAKETEANTAGIVSDTAIKEAGQ